MRIIEPFQWDMPELETLGGEAANLIQSHSIKYPLIGFKDPRTCRLLPFWQSVFDQLGVSDSYVIVVRNPLSVGRSLKTFSGFSSEKSHILWLEHLLSAVGHTHEKKRIIVDYDKIMTDPISQLRRMADILELTLDLSTHESIQEYANEFLHDELQHTIFSLDDIKLDISAPQLLYGMYECLHQSAYEQIDITNPEFRCKWEIFKNNFESLNTVFGSIDEYYSKLGTIEEAFSHAQGQLNTLKQVRNELDELRSFNDKLQGDYEALRSWDDRLQGDHEALRSWTDKLQGHNIRLSEELKNTSTELEALSRSMLVRITAPFRTRKRTTKQGNGPGPKILV